MKAFLGTGLLGSGFIQALLEKGEEVHVWNRTLSKAKSLESAGAKVFETPAEAVKDADTIHLALKDDDSVNEVLEMMLPGLKKGAVIVDHTTTSVAGAQERSAKWKEKGFNYQHAPVLMGPKNARESTGTMLVSGDQELIKQLTPVLSPMTGTLMNLGSQTGKAAAMKLAANLFLITLNGAISDTIAFSKATGISMDELIMLFKDWNPGVAVTGRMQKVSSGNFDHPSWELSMARKDAGLMMKESEAAGISLSALPGVINKMDGLIDAGNGQKDWSIIARIPD